MVQAEATTKVGKSSPLSAQVEVACGGDLELIIGEEGVQVKLLVSSTILKLASPVFAVLLGPNFKEGHDSAPTAGLPKSVCLPDDDPEAMLWVCQILHYVRKEPMKADLALLGKIATHCDKYDLAYALGPWAEYRLQVVECHTMEESLSLLYCAIMLANNKAFHKSTKYLVLHVARLTPLAMLAIIQDYKLDGQLLASIEAKKEQSIRCFQLRVESIISMITAPIIPQKETRQHTMLLLRRANFWPVSSLGSHASLHDLINDARAIVGCAGSRECWCDSVEAEKTINVAADKALVRADGLCLTCYKEGAMSRNQGNCLARDARECLGIQTEGLDEHGM
ncbi:uncharacterized protein KY384_008261 [Bacidia gigantensis]|uniref:uncharacterized protein n=1 Tax=Bacidia gigantensis TaxID=2732470 RepID=UPI001D046054|nr:uncharacterized protein KY384_008261 [Bacidia gigantensis]KAG8526832.1 hypothetical protein KY384_008261 [Bacidia gigantensis]